MPRSISPGDALARWLAHGLTSLTHPVLDFALRSHLNPVGVEAAWLEAEPFSVLESGQGEWWLTRPAWNPSRIDRSSPAAADFGPLLGNPAHFSVRVDSRGVILPSLTATGAGDPASRRFLEFGEEAWRAVRHTVRASHDAEAFIHASAAFILAGDPLSAAYASGEDGEFCRAVRGRLAAARGES
jgi:hypothetical protein